MWYCSGEVNEFDRNQINKSLAESRIVSRVEFSDFQRYSNRVDNACRGNMPVRILFKRVQGHMRHIVFLKTKNLCYGRQGLILRVVCLPCSTEKCVGIRFKILLL